MLTSVPDFVSIAFVLTTLLSLYLTWRILMHADISQRMVSSIMIGIAVWLIAHAVLALNRVYIEGADQIPPPFLFILIFLIALILTLFLSRWGRTFMDKLPLLQLTQLSIVRIPVEIVLYWLFVHQAIPELMTFAGRNFDILAGLTAPFVAYFGIYRRKMGRSSLLLWNAMGLGLLLFIIVNAVLSAPTFIQQFGFEQPNVGLLHFPFLWLAAFVAPAVLISHLVSIRQLVMNTWTDRQRK